MSARIRDYIQVSYSHILHTSEFTEQSTVLIQSHKFTLLTHRLHILRHERPKAATLPHKTDALAAASPFHQGLQSCLSCYLTHGCLVEVACVEQIV